MVKNVPDSNGFCGCIRFQTVAILKAGLKDSLHKPRMSICVHLRFRPVSETRNAIRKDFEQAHRNLHKNDAMKLILNVEIHLEEALNLDEISVSDMISDLKLERNAMEWFLEYD